MNFNGGKIPSLFKGIKDVCWKGLYNKMEPKLNSNDFSFEKYFLYDGNTDLPKYAGYWVGFNLVADYLSYSGISEVEALGLQAEEYFNMKV